MAFSKSPRPLVRELLCGTVLWSADGGGGGGGGGAAAAAAAA
eukprot:SAG22_NODE_1784_length_3588_cov_27.751791_5_plen_41_part_01